jgi:hypothetical protein
MPDEAAASVLKASLKAEACRRLADTAENEFRKALWIERARHWDQLASEAANQMQRPKPAEV